MMKLLFLLIILCSLTSCELLQTKSKKLNCTDLKSLHPKSQAVCVLKTEVELLRNLGVKKIVKAYEKLGLRNSNDYQVSLIKGGGTGESIYWRYLVLVSFNDFKKYESVAGVVEIFASKPPKLQKVLRGGDLR